VNLKMKTILKRLKPVTVITLVTFIALSLRVDLLATAAAQSSSQPGFQKKVTSASQFQDLLKNTERLLGEIEADLNTNKDISSKLSQLKNNKTNLNQLANKLRAEFNQTKADLLSKKLSDEIIKRHEEFIGKFEAKLTTLLNNLQEIEKAKGQEIREKVKNTREFLNKNIYKPKHIPTSKPTHRLKELKQAPKQEARLFLPGKIFAKLSNFFVSNAEASEVQITQEIIDLATSLDNSPLKIYQFIRNNIAYEPYYGSLKGAIGCLHDKAGNDFDQASLLISLLNAANIQARYVYGQVEIPIEKAKSWVGIDNPWRVGDLLVTYGIPAVTIVKGGQPSTVRIEHCWVEAFIDYVPSRGAIHKQGDTWIPLDPSFKTSLTYKPTDLSSQVPFNTLDYLSKQQTGDALDYYTNQLEAYLEQTMPDTFLSQIGKIEMIEVEEIPYFLSSFPYKLVSILGKYTEIPDSLRYKVKVTIPGDGVLTEDLIYQISLPELNGKRLTLSYTGTRSPYTNPAYTVLLKPTIKLDEVVQVTGDEIGAGTKQSVIIELTMPNQPTERIENEITAGEFHTLVCTWPSSNGESMMEMSQRLNTNITNLGDTFLDTNGFIKEDLTGDFLYLRGKSWFTQVGLSKELASSFMHLPMFPDLGFAEISVEADVDYLFDIPYKMTLSGLMIDADRNTCLVVPKAGEDWKTKEFMTLTGYASSGLEHFIWEQKYGPGGISAVKAIQIANEQGIPVYDINSTNEDLIDTLSISDIAKEDMHNAINAGYVIKTPAQNITYNTWTGVGYIVLNPITGEGRYEIGEGSGGYFYYMPANAEKGRWALVCVMGIKKFIVPMPTNAWNYLGGHAEVVAKELSQCGYEVAYGSVGTVAGKEWLLWLLSWPHFEIFYWCGHGYVDEEGRSTGDIKLCEWARDIGDYPEDAWGWFNYSEIWNRIDPDQYKLVFLNGCQTAQYSGWAIAFGIDYKTKYNEEAFIGNDESPNAFNCLKVGKAFFKELKVRNVYEAITMADSVWQPLPGKCSVIPPYEVAPGTVWFPPSGVTDYWRFLLP